MLIPFSLRIDSPHSKFSCLPRRPNVYTCECSSSKSVGGLFPSAISKAYSFCSFQARSYSTKPRSRTSQTIFFVGFRPPSVILQSIVRGVLIGIGQSGIVINSLDKGIDGTVRQHDVGGNVNQLRSLFTNHVGAQKLLINRRKDQFD